MARLDTITQATWQPGSLLTGVVADNTTVVSMTSLPGGWYLVGFVASCDIAWVYDIQILTSASALSQNRSQRLRPAAGNETFYLPSAIHIPDGGQIIVKTVGAITVVGLQGAIYIQMGSITKSTASI